MLILPATSMVNAGALLFLFKIVYAIISGNLHSNFDTIIDALPALMCCIIGSVSVSRQSQ
jgi:hypothetical protein